MAERQDNAITERLFDRFGDVIDFRIADGDGVSRAVLRRSESRGLIIRVAKSAFVLAGRYRAASERDQFRLRALGFAMCNGATVHLTGWAAAVMLGLPTIGAVPLRPVAVRPGNAHTASDATQYGRVRTGHLPPQHRTMRQGVAVVSPAYCAVDVARHYGSLPGLLVSDAVLASGVPRESLSKLTREMERYPGMANARWAVEHADPRCESPLESLGRMAFLTAARRPPESNVWFAVGGRHFRVDHYAADAGVVLEGDGALKYNNRDDADQIVFQEKERERLLRSMGLGFVRYNWSLALYRPVELLRRFDAEAKLVAPGFRSVRWTEQSPSAGVNFAQM